MHYDYFVLTPHASTVMLFLFFDLSHQELHQSQHVAVKILFRQAQARSDLKRVRKTNEMLYSLTLTAFRSSNPLKCVHIYVTAVFNGRVSFKYFSFCKFLYQNAILCFLSRMLHHIGYCIPLICKIKSKVL